MSSYVSFSKLFGIGCGDNSCRWGPQSVGTNGGCRCYGRDGGHRSTAEMQYQMKLYSGVSLLRQIAALPEVEAALIELVRLTKDGKKED